jgi:predicted Rossmann fold nucleotide-binding protein DprA/Smf involved in DNA uptake
LPRRIPPELKPAFEVGRLLILSAFPEIENRATSELAARRNEIVAALADEVYIAHATPGGALERLATRVEGWERKKL